MTGAVLAIDQGTSGTKAVIADADDRILAVAEVPLRPDYRPGGVVEQDPLGLLASVKDACAAALAQAGQPRIAAVALANQGESVLAWHPTTGEPLSPIVVWQDGRAEEVCQLLALEREGIGQQVAELTGLVLDPYFSAPKLAWIRRHLTRDGVVSTTDAWLIHQLCGRSVTDSATASRSLLTALGTTDYHPLLVDWFGMAGEQLPEIVANDAVIGETELFGLLPHPVPLAGAIIDQQAALLAQGCLEPGAAKCTFGTGAFLLANLGSVGLASQVGLSLSTAWTVDGETTLCADGQVYTAASAVRWLSDIGVITDAKDLDRLGSEDAHGVRCVPAFAGLAAPWWDSAATCSFTGLTLSSSRGDLVTALLQGLAAQVAELARLVGHDLGRPLTQLKVDGGLTRSRRLMQSVADLAQVEVVVYPSAHATPLGAVALARKALNPMLGLGEAIVAWQPQQVFSPNWEPERAADFLASWLAQVESCNPRKVH